MDVPRGQILAQVFALEQNLKKREKKSKCFPSLLGDVALRGGDASPLPCLAPGTAACQPPARDAFQGKAPALGTAARFLFSISSPPRSQPRCQAAASFTRRRRLRPEWEEVGAA